MFLTGLIIISIAIGTMTTTTVGFLVLGGGLIAGTLLDWIGQLLCHRD